MKSLPWLILLPGLHGTGELFSPLVGQLQGRVDCRVHSYSPSKFQTIQELAEEVLKQPDHVESAVILAESFSGLVLLELLIEGGLKPAGVIFSAAFAYPPRPLIHGVLRFLPVSLLLQLPLPDLAIRLALVGPRAGPEITKLVRDAIRKVDPAVLAHRLRLVGATSFPDGTKMNVPCLYLQGKDDQLVPASCCSWFEKCFSKLRVEMIDGPHLLLQIQPKKAGKKVLEFIEGLGAERA